MDPLQNISSSPPPLKRKRKSRKQLNPVKRIIKGSKLDFGCSKQCECECCVPSLPGDCAGNILDFLQKWPKEMTIKKYGFLIGVDLQTEDRDSFWWTGVIRMANKVDTLQYNVFNRYRVGLQKRAKHPLVQALLSGNIKRLPWVMFRGNVWDTLPDSAREVTFENQQRVNGFVFLEVERRTLYTHLFKLELQFESIEEEDGSFQLSPMSWRFTVRPHWKYVCGQSHSGVGYNYNLFVPPHKNQQVTVGDRLHTFSDLENNIISDDDAWLLQATVTFNLSAGTGSWLPYGSFIQSAQLCRSRCLEQYYHVGIVESEYEKGLGFVEKIKYYPDAFDISIPLMECLSGAKGSNREPMLICRQYSLKNGLLTNACPTTPINANYLVTDGKQDIFYI